MELSPKKIRIAVTGPESTGKTTLAKQLAERYNGRYIPEYAREYVESLPGHYTYDDVVTIAKKQVDQYLETIEGSATIFFFDTWLIVTKVWFSWVFDRMPDWLEDRINTCPIDLFLICSPDLPWEADAVRENGGENRIKLYEQYKLELKHYNFNFVEICGTGDERLENAVRAIDDFGILH
jgi:NadR type nicotinamide-nucleotide adenylyltransferase